MLEAKFLDTPMSTSARIDKDEVGIHVIKPCTQVSLDHFYALLLEDVT